jgi:hypothetical protein
MTRFRFIELIKHPVTVEYEEIDELKSIIDQFPYFQSVRLLYVKALFEHKSYLYDEELKRTAAYASDRKMLYRLIHHTGENKTSTQVVDPSFETKNVQEKELSLTDGLIFEEKTFEEEATGFVFEEAPDNIKTEAEHIADDIDEDIEPPIIFTEEIPGPQIKSDPKPADEPIKSEQKPLSAAEILSQRLREIENPSDTKSPVKEEKAAAEVTAPIIFQEAVLKIVKEQKEETAVEETIIEEQPLVKQPEAIVEEKPIEEIKPVLSAATLPPSVQVNEPVVKEEPLQEQTINKVSPVQRGHETQSFSDWLHRFQKPSSEEKKTPDTSVNNPETPLNQPAALLTITDVEQQINNTTPDNPEPGHFSAKDLVQLFIKNEPRIDGTKTKFSTPGNIARASLADSSDIVSETLARIYLEQGNISRSIQTYEKLMMRFPEKSVYFAALIKEIRKSQL